MDLSQLLIQKNVDDDSRVPEETIHSWMKVHLFCYSRTVYIFKTTSGVNERKSSFKLFSSGRHFKEVVLRTGDDSIEPLVPITGFFFTFSTVAYAVVVERGRIRLLRFTNINVISRAVFDFFSYTRMT